MENESYRSEGGIKLAVCGHIGVPNLARKVNGTSNEEACIFPRYSSLFRSILKSNQEAFEKKLHVPLVESLSGLKNCPNAAQVCQQKCASKYLLNSVTVSVQSQRWNSSRMLVHDDGSAGMLLMGLQTSAGHRELHLGLADGSIVKVPCEPGHLYLCNVAAVKHQVVHPSKVQGIKVAGLGRVEVALVVRSTWFGLHKARGSQGLEGRAFFKPTMEVLNNFLSSTELKLPSLQEVIAEYECSAHFGDCVQTAKRPRLK